MRIPKRNGWGLAALLAGMGCSTPASVQSVGPQPSPAEELRSALPPAEGESEAGLAQTQAWVDAVKREAAALQQRWEEAVVRIVVLDVETGTVLARHGPVEEPHLTGSSIKPFTVGAALQLGLDPAMMISGAAEVIDGRRFEDYQPTVSMTVPGVLIRSSNVGTVRIVRELGSDAVGAAVSEMTGLVLEPELDELGRIGRLTGHDTRLPLMSLAQSYAMLARRGVDPSRGRQVLDPDAADQVVAALERAVLEGTGTSAAVPGIRVAGKTGTALWDSGNTASFLGFGPLPTPQWVVAVVVEGLPRDGFGGAVSGAAFANIVRAAVVRPGST